MNPLCFYSCIPHQAVSGLRSGAERSPPSSHLQAPVQQASRAPEATDRLDIVAGDY